MEKTKLLQALKVCKPALGENLIKGLECFHFQGRKISASNGHLLLSSELEEDLPVNGSITGETLFKIINELDKDVELITNNSQLIVKAGRSKSTFPIENPDLTFLEDLEENVGRSFLPTKLLFAAGLKRCIASVGGKGIPQDQIGIHVFIDTPSTENADIKSECRMYSTNGIIYSRFIYPLDVEVPISQTFLPASFCEQLINLYSELDQEPDEIVLTQKYVRAKFGSTLLRHSFYANPVSWEMRGQVDQGIENTTLVDLPKSILEALKRCEIIANNTSINLSKTDDSPLALKAIGSKGQELIEEVELEYPFDIDLNLDLKGLRKLMETCKQVGFGQDYLLLVGNEDYYDVILPAKEN